MNIFEILLLNLILLSFPMLLYMLYILTDKNLHKKRRDSFLALALTSSFFLLFKYGLFFDNLMLAFYTSSIIFLALLYRHFFLAIFLACLNILFVPELVFYLLVAYGFMGGLVYMRSLRQMEDSAFVQLFILIYVIFFFFFSIFYYENIWQSLIIVATFLYGAYFLYFLLTHGADRLRTHLKYKEIQNDRQMQLSLFKITHEIKNPIAVCKAYLDMFDVNNHEHTKKYVPIIKAEIERLLILLQDFMLVNRENIKYEVMDMNILLEDVVNKMDELMNKNHINFKVDIKDEELFINGDYNRLSQVLINLLKNSLEANPKEISLKYRQNNCNIELYISDNGTGIEEDILKQIYEPFYTTKESGTGLGVSLSNEIIMAHNGKMEYFSIPNRGTTVKITIPIYQL